MRRRAIAFALLSAALFGASTPLAKLLLGSTSPLLLAGLLYLGAGIGLAAWLALRGGFQPIARGDLPWLGAAVITGGIAGPALLMFGLARTDGATASLLLNLEAVFTAVIAWVAFRENVDRRVLAGMGAIVAGGVILSFETMPASLSFNGQILISAACLAWALDNNLTRRISGGDAATIACIKGLVAGSVNFALALLQDAHVPAPGFVAIAGVVGVLGYGVSLALFIVALRDLGTARTAAYFSVAPFFGAALALLLPAETPGAAFWVAAALMALGVWLHISERHGHAHTHEPLAHQHEHVHDEHHHHEHAFPWDGKEPHVHPHEHDALSHTHRHHPDLHHRHRH
jgi:drug/metabolite transporter (DMT)-like permease